MRKGRGGLRGSTCGAAATATAPPLDLWPTGVSRVFRGLKPVGCTPSCPRPCLGYCILYAVVAGRGRRGGWVRLT